LARKQQTNREGAKAPSLVIERKLMERISLQLLERRICELTGALNEVQGMKNYVLKMEEQNKKAPEAPKTDTDAVVEPFVERK
jgi:hypothetical protein